MQVEKNIKIKISIDEIIKVLRGTYGYPEDFKIDLVIEENSSEEDQLEAEVCGYSFDGKWYHINPLWKVTSSPTDHPRHTKIEAVFRSGNRARGTIEDWYYTWSSTHQDPIVKFREI